MLSRPPLALAASFAVLLGGLWSACDATHPDVEASAASPTSPPSPAPAAEARGPRGPIRVAVALDGQARIDVEARLAAAPSLAVVGSPAEADVEVGDARLRGGTRYVVRSWAAITDQRRDVLELTVSEVRSVLSGEVTDWSQLGGRAQPIKVYLAAADVPLVAEALGVDASSLRATVRTPPVVAAAVARRPGAFGLVPAPELRPGVLALVVDGHDAYRDPAGTSPLRLERIVRAGDPATADRVAAAAGFVAAEAAFDPIGVLATGELIPARCTNAALEEVGDFNAMFDGTRRLLRAADLAVMALEVPLTDLSPPTPCVQTFVLQGRPEAVDAVADAGIDMMITAGNHAMDCWDGCSGAAALMDTLRRFDRAGIAHVGAASDLAAARMPVLMERGDIRFAFLGYDSIAPWYAATADSPGTAPLDLATLAQDVRRAKVRADHVIVGFGWGVEYTTEPTAFQCEAAGVAVDAGASLVVGNHPHWAQAVEVIDGAVVAYALGNFVFDQSWSVETTQGMVIEVGFTADRMLGYRLRPVVIRGLDTGPRHIFRPEFVDPAAEGAPILDRVWEASDRLPARGSGGR